MTIHNDINKEFKESDWKLFRKRISIWQEAYIAKLNLEYITVLTQNKDASNKFWELEKRIQRDKKKPGVIIDMRRSTMILNILNLLQDEVITLDDLTDFSDMLKDTINIYMKPLHKRSWKHE